MLLLDSYYIYSMIVQKANMDTISNEDEEEDEDDFLDNYRKKRLQGNVMIFF